MNLIQLVSVPDIASNNTARQRIAGLMGDRETLVVASMLAGAAEAVIELAAKLADLQHLAEAVLAGDARAKTEPGLACKLSAFALVLSSVCKAANAFSAIEDFSDDAGHEETSGGPDGDRAAAQDDGDPA